MSSEIRRLEMLAKELESNENYRVLRKIRPKAAFCQTGEIKEPLLILVLDTETTGIDYKTHEILEIGCLLIEVDKKSGVIGRILSGYSGLEEPKVEISLENSLFHGITNKMVAGKHFDEEMLHALYCEADFVLSHNADFDRKFMDVRFDWTSQTPWLCSLKDIDWADYGIASSKLEFIIQQCGYFHKAHRAVEDCNALLHVLSTPQPVGDGGQIMPFQVIFQNANKSKVTIGAYNAAFDTRQVLKDRGFTFNGENKIWEIAVEEPLLPEVLAWLKEVIYGGRPAKVMYRKDFAHQRYSLQKSKETLREI
jgi:DNA polymerase III subunit epsilon